MTTLEQALESRVEHSRRDDVIYIEIGGNPGWEWDTIDGYQRRRRGRGWAAGTTADLTGHRS